MKIKMKFKALAVAMLLSSGLAYGDIVTGSSGADWRNWDGSVLNNNGTPYWDGTSSDGTNYNIGDCLTNAGACAGKISGAPGAIPYWGFANGSADSSFYLQKTGSSDSAALKIEIAGNKDINSFGWYDTTDQNRTQNQIFSNLQGAGQSSTFTPTATYGFYFIGSQGTYYTQATGDGRAQHFAIFQQSGAAGSEVYWLGMEDLNLQSSDKDYQDMVVKISGVSVPEPGVFLFLAIMLGSLGMFGLMVRRFAR
jgi:hypothetical protein